MMFRFLFLIGVSLPAISSANALSCVEIFQAPKNVDWSQAQLKGANSDLPANFYDNYRRFYYYNPKQAELGVRLEYYDRNYDDAAFMDVAVSLIPGKAAKTPKDVSQFEPFTAAHFPSHNPLFGDAGKSMDQIIEGMKLVSPELKDLSVKSLPNYINWSSPNIQLYAGPLPKTFIVTTDGYIHTKYTAEGAPKVINEPGYLHLVNFSISPMAQHDKWLVKLPSDFKVSSVYMNERSIVLFGQGRSSITLPFTLGVKNRVRRSNWLAQLWEKVFPRNQKNRYAFNQWHILGADGVYFGHEHVPLIRKIQTGDPAREMNRELYDELFHNTVTVYIDGKVFGVHQKEDTESVLTVLDVNTNQVIFEQPLGKKVEDEVLSQSTFIEGSYGRKSGTIVNDKTIRTGVTTVLRTPVGVKAYEGIDYIIVLSDNTVYTLGER